MADRLVPARRRGRALAGIAAEVGPTAEGRVLLGEALALAEWAELIEEIVLVAPEWADPVADLLLGEEPRWS